MVKMKDVRKKTFYEEFKDLFTQISEYSLPRAETYKREIEKPTGSVSSDYAHVAYLFHSNNHMLYGSLNLILDRMKKLDDLIDKVSNDEIIKLRKEQQKSDNMVKNQFNAILKKLDEQGNVNKLAKEREPRTRGMFG